MFDDSIDYTEFVKENIKSMTNMNKSADENISNGISEIIKPIHPKLIDVKITLESKSLWNQFDKHGTEMIVTRSGR